MTLLRYDAPVTRETATCYRGRPLIVELHSCFLMLREKGRHQSVTLDYSAAYDMVSQKTAGKSNRL